jgi:single-strand DNA-binding protein
MARGLNKAMIIGYVEREPELRHTNDGQSVVSFSVSTSRQWTTNSGEARQSTEWFHIVAWGDLAEVACGRLSRGHRVYAEGLLQTRSWEDASGHRQLRTEFVAEKLIPFGIGEVDETRVDSTEAEGAPLCLNRVMVMGNLGRDPEMRYTPDGQAVTSFSLAASRSLTTRSGERRASTQWFNVVSWGSLAEICNEYLSKGRRVYVEGELRTRSWEQPGGKKHFRTELVADEMIMLGPRPAANLQSNASPVWSPSQARKTA